MKKSFIFLICCIFTVAAKAQTSAGNTTSVRFGLTSFSPAIGIRYHFGN